MDTDALWQTARGRWPEIDEGETRLICVEKLYVEYLRLKEQATECIALKPVGDFVMGYGPRADVLVVQEVRA